MVLLWTRKTVRSIKELVQGLPACTESKRVNQGCFTALVLGYEEGDITAVSDFGDHQVHGTYPSVVAA